MSGSDYKLATVVHYGLSFYGGGLIATGRVYDGVVIFSIALCMQMIKFTFRDK